MSGFLEDSSEQATLSASPSGIGDKGVRDVARPAHLAAKSRVRGMIQGAATARLLPGHPLLARLDTSIESATAASLDAPQLG